MRDWLAAMCHPDGEIGFFNDAATGIAPALQELERYAARLGLAARAPRGGPLTHLAASGYVRVERPDAVALLDVAALSVDYLPGHAHADTLTFELSLFGGRVIVNSGTSCYGTSPERLRQRGTAAHNTVVVNGENSSEVWSGFRVGRRARPVGLALAGGGETVVRCGHDGYRRLPGRPEHRRAWIFAGGGLVIEDRVAGRFASAEARFHLHPSVTCHGTAGGAATLQLPGRGSVRLSVEGGALSVEPSTWHPAFGRSEANVCLRVRFEGPLLRTRFDWAAA
jgi:uncharacterized heparinase superfamily protein